MLRASNLIGFGGGGGDADFAFMSEDHTPVNTNSPRFNGMFAGRPHKDRYLLFTFCGWDNAINDATWGLNCTIGGVAASEINVWGYSAGNPVAVAIALFGAHVPDGWEVDVEVNAPNFGGTFNVWESSLIRTTRLTSLTPLAITETNFATPPDASIATTGAKAVFWQCGDNGNSRASDVGTSSYGSSRILTGHRQAHSSVFLDTNPRGSGSDTYSVSGAVYSNPDTVFAVTLT